MKRRVNPHRGGWMFTDALVALGIIAVATALLAATLIRVTKATRTLSQHRVALRMANHTLLSLQTDPALSADRPPEGTTIAPEAAWPAPAGWRWVRIRAAYHDGRAELTGLIRSNP